LTTYSVETWWKRKLRSWSIVFCHLVGRGIHMLNYFNVVPSSKETISTVKRQPEEWENIYQLFIWQGTNIQNLLRAQNIKHQQNKIQLIHVQMNWTKLSKEVQMANKHVKKCSISLSIKKSKSFYHWDPFWSLRFHLNPVRMVIIKKTNNKCWQR
jgi:hypothetical protein